MKKKSFLLLEALIAISILAFIVGFGLNLLSSQLKNNHQFQKFKKSFYEKVFLKKEIKEIFYHIKSDQKDCLVSRGDQLYLVFDAGTFLNPAISGTQQGRIFLKQKKLQIEILKQDSVIYTKVLSEQIDRFDIWFFDSKKLWQKSWNPEKEQLPEMIRIEIESSKKVQKFTFLLPSNLKPIKLECS